jgi:hypothetical protein
MTFESKIEPKTHHSQSDILLIAIMTMLQISMSDYKIVRPTKTIRTMIRPIKISNNNF